MTIISCLNYRTNILIAQVSFCCRKPKFIFHLPLGYTLHVLEEGDFFRGSVKFVKWVTAHSLFELVAKAIFNPALLASSKYCSTPSLASAVFTFSACKILACSLVLFDSKLSPSSCLK